MTEEKTFRSLITLINPLVNVDEKVCQRFVSVYKQYLTLFGQTRLPHLKSQEVNVNGQRVNQDGVTTKWSDKLPFIREVFEVILHYLKTSPL